MEYRKIQHALLTVLEAPNNRKGYLLLKKCYESLGMVENAAALDCLIKKRFGDEDHSASDTGKEQSDH